MRSAMLAGVVMLTAMLSVGRPADPPDPSSDATGQDAPREPSGQAGAEASRTVPRAATVIVSAGGMDKDEATRQAKRKAVERVAGTYIVSTTETRDYALIRDTILTRSNGFVERFEVIEQHQEPDGVCVVKARATVSVGGILDAWAVVRGLLGEMGRPKIMVCVRERIDDDVRDGSTVQTRLEKLLLESGFDLVDRTQLEAIERERLDAALRKEKKTQLGAIARRHGAHLFITGTAWARFERTGEVYRIPVQFYGGSANLRCFATDNAKLLSSRSAASTGADRMAARSASKALELLGETIAPRMRADILRHWQNVLEGLGEVTLIVSPLSFTALGELEDELAKLRGVREVASTYESPIARITIQADVRAPELAKRIAKSLDDRLEITSLKPNVIEARAKQTPDLR